MKRQSRGVLVLALLGVLFLGGCASSLIGEGTPPTRFFILSPLTLPPSAEKAVSAPEKELIVAVEPLKIPSYLDRSQIVIRTGDNELFISEFNQWGENLQSNLSRVLIENLSLLLDSDRVYLMPGIKRQSPHFRVLARVVQFERGKEGAARLTVRWKLYDREKKTLFRENIVLTGEKVSKGDYTAITQAMSHLLADFSKRIVTIIGQQPG